ncbi:thioredoxin-like protein, partial [Gorgonomyces haynaldii]
REQKSILSLLFAPIGWGLKLMWTIWTYSLSWIPGLTLSRIRTTRHLKSKAEQSQGFLKAFRQEFGNQAQFFEGTYQQAVQKSKQELQHLLVYLHSQEHPDTVEFCTETLSNKEFVDYLQEHRVLLWGGDIKDVEPFQVSNELKASGYPFLCLLIPDGSRLRIGYKFDGLHPRQQILDVLERVLSKGDQLLNKTRAERQERQQARSIREQQDAAYQASLLADKEKKRKQEEERQKLLQEQERLKALENEEENKRKAKIERKEALARNLEQEPTTGDICKISIRLPSGERLIRKFRADDAVSKLYDFVESKDLSPLDLMAEIVIVNTYPRKEIPRETRFKDCGLYPNASVVVDAED